MTTIVLRPVLLEDPLKLVFLTNTSYGHIFHSRIYNVTKMTKTESRL